MPELTVDRSGQGSSAVLTERQQGVINLERRTVNQHRTSSGEKGPVAIDAKSQNGATRATSKSKQNIEQTDNNTSPQADDRRSGETLKPLKEVNQSGSASGERTSVISVEIREKKEKMKTIDHQESEKSTMEGEKPGIKPVMVQQRQDSLVQTAKREAQKLESDPSGNINASQTHKPTAKKKTKKGIFVSYSPDSGFTERKFVVETVKQLKENNLAEDIWFDKDEQNTDSPCWFSYRMEAVERCKAAILVLSESYFSCPVSIYEAKTILERLRTDPLCIKLFPIVLSLPSDYDIPKPFSDLFVSNTINLHNEHAGKSLAEKSSIVIGQLMSSGIEKYASVHTSANPAIPPDADFTGEYRQKKISQWTASDLQEWLFKLGIKEFYRQSLAESMVDGFLLMSLTDQDMATQLGIDSRVVRKKIMQQILVTLDREHKLPENWHLRARTQRARPATLYLVYDPADVRLAQNLKHDLVKKNLQVLHHQKLGQSKEEFLQLNGPQMATATHILILMTDAAVSSPFVFHEVLFADWLGKKLITAMFKNTWEKLRPVLKSVLGECPAVDFETKMYTECMDVLDHHLKPVRTMPGVVLEQAYLNKMTEGLKPLSLLATLQGVSEWAVGTEPRLFISYQWDMQSKVEEIRRILEANSIPCWVDISPTMTGGQRGHSGTSMRSAQPAEGHESLQAHIQRNMKSSIGILSCITPKYMQSDNCIKDLSLAENLHKPIVPVMLRFCPWPPDGAPPQVRKILVKHAPIDLSNEKLFKQNIHLLIDRIRKIISNK